MMRFDPNAGAKNKKLKNLLYIVNTAIRPAYDTILKIRFIPNYNSV